MIASPTPLVPVCVCENDHTPCFSVQCAVCSVQCAYAVRISCCVRCEGWGGGGVTLFSCESSGSVSRLSMKEKFKSCFSLSFYVGAASTSHLTRTRELMLLVTLGEEGIKVVEH